MLWMPVNSQQPQSNLVTFTNNEFYNKETEEEQYRYKLDEVRKLEWISVDKKIESTPYTFPLT